MEELEKENLHLDKALAVIWSEIHCLHDDIEFMMDLIQNVNEHVKQASPHVCLSQDPMCPPFPSVLVSKSCVWASSFGVLLSYVLNADLFTFPQISKIPCYPLLWYPCMLDQEFDCAESLSTVTNVNVSIAFNISPLKSS